MGEYGTTKGGLDLDLITAKEILDYMLSATQTKVGAKQYSEMAKEIKNRIQTS